MHWEIACRYWRNLDHLTFKKEKQKKKKEQNENKNKGKTKKWTNYIKDPFSPLAKKPNENRNCTKQL